MEKSQKVSEQSVFIGGISDYDKLGGVDSYAFGRSIDVRSNPREIKLLPKTALESGSIIQDLVKWGQRISIPPTDNPVGVNLLPNTSFETNTTGWTLEAGFTRVNTFAYDGTFSVQQSTTSGYNNFYSDAITVEANTDYTLEFYARVTLNAGNLLPIAQVNGGSAFGASLLPSLYYILQDTSGAWVKQSITVNTGSNTTVYIRIFNNNGNITAFYDNFSFYKVDSSQTYLYDRSGKLYLRSSQGEYTLARTIPDSHGNGLKYYAEDRHLYYTSDKAIGRYGDFGLSSKSYADDFLSSFGGSPSNTHSLVINGTTQYATAADSASLSITSDLTIEAYVKLDALPTVGNYIFIMGKWDESGTLRSYKMDINAVSGVFGDGSGGALSITSDVTQSPTIATASATAGTKIINATGAFIAGQQILIHQTQGTGAGTFQRTKVISYSAGVITVEDDVNFSYTSSATAKAQVMVLVQYSSVTIGPSGIWRPTAWNGNYGGILAFLCSGALTVSGSLSASGRGFRGGTGGTSTTTGTQGESYLGTGIGSNSANGGGGGGGDNLGGQGVGGGIYGTASLSSINLGSGGGGANDASDVVTGGNGGGALVFWASSMTVSGTVLADGSNGTQNGNASGAGSGGSIRANVQDAILGTGLVRASGGVGVVSTTTERGNGAGGGHASVGQSATNSRSGDGGSGRIAVYYLTTYSGTTTPSATFVQDNSLISTTTYNLRLGVSSTGLNSEFLSRAIELQTGIWTRLAISWDASASLATFYKDGVKLGTSTGTLTAIHDNASLFSIGAGENSGGSYAFFLDGKVDDVRVWNDLRTDSEILLFKDSEMASNAANLQAYYKLNNASTDATANANNLTLVGSPTYDSNDVPFSNSSTRLDIDQSRDASTNTYTLETSIDESTTNKRIEFTPTRDPQKSIAIEVDTVGTGNWTVTIHDARNNLIASKTVANADVRTGFFEFIFDSVWRPVLGQTYHAHVTSTVADGEVVANTASNLNTGGFVTYYQFLVNDENYHPMDDIVGKLAIGNERYLATWDVVTYNPHRLTLPADHKIRCFAKWNEYLAIGTWIGNSITDVEYGRVFFWDGTSDTYNFYIDVPEGAINSMLGSAGTLYISAGYKGDILSYAGGSRAFKLKRLPKTSKDKYIEVYPQGLSMWDKLLRIGTGISDSTLFERGVYTYGAENESQSDFLTYDYPISTQSRTSTTVEIGMVMPVNNKLLVSWKDGSTYGVDVVDPSGTCFESGTIELLIRDEGGVWKEKRGLNARADFKPLRSGESISIKYRQDREDEWRSVTQSTVGENHVKIPVSVSDGRYREIQVATDLQTSSGLSPTVLGISLEHDLLLEERAF